ncbi:UNVERIFIED_CONTAM: hypothetical protein LK11_47155 [Mumia flava]|nr:dienelactone hydrolase family protein [Mumia flava]
MAEIVVFHHAQGQTGGFLAFVDDLRSAGHTVHAPDYYDGRTFPTVDAGVAYAEEEAGRDELVRRVEEAAATLPAEVVWVGMSLGSLFAQKYAQTRRGARGAVLLYGALPPEVFGTPWPSGVGVQVHAMADDPWVDWEGEVAPVRALDEAEVFSYPGSGHLFAETDSVDYDADATALLRERVHAFLARID